MLTAKSEDIDKIIRLEIGALIFQA